MEMEQTDHLHKYSCLGEKWPPNVLPIPFLLQRVPLKAPKGWGWWCCRQGRSTWISSALKGSLTALVLPTEGIRNLLLSEVLCINRMLEKYLLSAYYV